MLSVLAELEDETLPRLLMDPNWSSLDINHENPRVERVWRQWGDYRICLHRIHQCAEDEAHFHPHPWPSAMRIISGHYEMGIGYSETDQPPPCAAVVRGSDGMTYEMTDPNGWHYVRPLSREVISLMITGKRWGRTDLLKPQGLKPLSEDRLHEIIDIFARIYVSEDMME
tara:strand:+ start:69406 stop:69915 length:510 start_codon:yes stop_codon:yes gene_type:complete